MPALTGPRGQVDEYLGKNVSFRASLLDPDIGRSTVTVVDVC
jgi:hypothetical protein